MIYDLGVLWGGILIDPKICRLEAYEEAVGVLHSVHETNGYILANIGPVVVILPFKLGPELEPLTGERIGILRTEKDFRLRTFSPKIVDSRKIYLRAVVSDT